jgi:hypothetical protein|tara:strand:+ start:6504 stop:6755 length:252 start_codon:yes stop_codon:yes gene_type:complete
MTKTKLPEWFDGEVYEEGNKVRNPFSGEEYKLNGEELSMYDFIMGAQMIVEMGMTTPKMVAELHKGLEWFRTNNPKAYMVLLD